MMEISSNKESSIEGEVKNPWSSKFAVDCVLQRAVDEKKSGTNIAERRMAANSSTGVDEVNVRSSKARESSAFSKGGVSGQPPSSQRRPTRKLMLPAKLRNPALSATALGGIVSPQYPSQVAAPLLMANTNVQSPIPTSVKAFPVNAAKKPAAKQKTQAKAKRAKKAPKELQLQRTEFDVVLGRGNKIAGLPGNQRFRMLVHPHRLAYNATDCPKKKRAIMERVVEEVKPGRFLEVPKSSNFHWGVGPYVQVEKARAIEKAAQALRERKWTEQTVSVSQISSAELSAADTNVFKPSCSRDKKAIDDPIREKAQERRAPATTAPKSGQGRKRKTTEDSLLVRKNQMAASNSSRAGYVLDKKMVGKPVSLGNTPTSVSTRGRAVLPREDETSEHIPILPRHALFDEVDEPLKPGERVNQENTRMESKPKTSEPTNSLDPPTLKPSSREAVAEHVPILPRHVLFDNADEALKPNERADLDSTRMECESESSQPENFLDPPNPKPASVRCIVATNDGESVLSPALRAPEEDAYLDILPRPEIISSRATKSAQQEQIICHEFPYREPTGRKRTQTSASLWLTSPAAKKQAVDLQRTRTVSSAEETKFSSVKSVSQSHGNAGASTTIDSPSKRNVPRSQPSTSLAKSEYFPSEDSDSDKTPYPPFTWVRDDRRAWEILAMDPDEESRIVEGVVVKQAGSNEKNGVATESGLPMIQSNDVLLGRGGSMLLHPGNMRFRKIIAVFKRFYSSLQHIHKRHFATEVLQLLTNPPVDADTTRFLELNRSSGKFHPVPRDRCVEKICQALRENSWAGTETATASRSDRRSHKPSSRTSSLRNRRTRENNRNVHSDNITENNREIKKEKNAENKKVQRRPIKEESKNVESLSAWVPLQSRIAVYWPLDDMWYPAVVEETIQDCFVYITYEDDQKSEWLDLSKHRYRLEQKQRLGKKEASGQLSTPLNHIFRGRVKRQAARRELNWKPSNSRTVDQAC